MNKRKLLHGFSLLELSIASAILSVGTLAVFTLYLHWRAAPDLQDARYQDLITTMLERPQPLHVRRFSHLKCERIED